MVDVRGHHRAIGIGIEVNERHAPLDPGIGDENVDRSDLRLDPFNRGLDCVAIGHIEGKRMRPCAVGDEPCACAFEFLRLVGVDHHFGTGRCQPLGEGEADAPARPGDQRDATREVEARSLQH